MPILFSTHPNITTGCCSDTEIRELKAYLFKCHAHQLTSETEKMLFVAFPEFLWFIGSYQAVNLELYILNVTLSALNPGQAESKKVHLH